MTTSYTDPFYGNGETDRFIENGIASKWFYIKALCGNTTPHAVLPFGRISAGAYSSGYPTGYGNHYPNSCGGIQKIWDRMKIRGFSHLHQSGTGAIRYYYNYAIVTPFYGGRENIYKYYEPSYEKAKPGYYETEFNGVVCVLTVNENTAIHRYSFKKDGGRLAVDFSNDGLSKQFGENFYGKVTPERFEIIDGKVCFSGVFSGVKLYFAVLVENADVSLFEDEMCAVFDFKADSAILKLSYSTLGFDEAIKNIDGTVRSFEETAKDAYMTWERYLSVIELETDDEELKKKFYSNFYHTIVKPCDMTGENILGVGGDVVSDIGTFWDMYKTQFPLIMLLYPDMGEKLARAVLNISRTMGRVRCSFGMSDIFPCEEQAKMLGIYTLLDAYYAGLAKKSDIDECILRELEREDFGEFLREGTFERYTHIIDTTDACIYAARVTENREVRERLLKLSENWKKAFSADGLLSEKSKYYEGDRYTYSFRPMANMAERVELCGGKEKFAMMLDSFFGFGAESVEQIRDLNAGARIEAAQHHRFEGFNNECDMEAPYSYIYADRHDRLCDIVHACVKDSFGTGTGGLPGNNDSGGLSSCFMWNVLGIFPLSGSGEFLLGSPGVDASKIKLSSGSTLEIRAVGRSDENIYVEKVTFNGREVTDFRLPAKDVFGGGELVFFMKG